DTLLHLGLGNAVVATVLALFAALAGRLGARPAWRHGLWLLVLLKLVAPPVVPMSVPRPVPAALEDYASLAEPPPQLPAVAPLDLPPPAKAPSSVEQDPVPEGPTPLPEAEPVVPTLVEPPSLELAVEPVPEHADA